MIEGICKGKAIESNLDVQIRKIETVMEMLEEDLLNGEEIAKHYYNFFNDMKLNLKQAKWSLAFERKLA